MTRSTWLGGLALLVSITMIAMHLPGCGRTQKVTYRKVEWRQVQPNEMSVQQKAQAQLAVAARDATANQYLGTLTTAMQSGGPVAAIEVCRTEAPAIAQQVSRQHHVWIGRTSFQKRNPRNTPPQWAQPVVDQRIGTPAYFVSNAGYMGVTLPILTAQLCLTCHGPRDQIAPDVLAALGQHYPADQATGFHEGDLRGWFWVEVPPIAHVSTDTP